jgi:hypothetical protein
MKHVRTLSQTPAPAQTSLCNAIDNDFQAWLCFALTVLSDIFLPLVQLKQPEDPPAGTTETT